MARGRLGRLPWLLPVSYLAHVVEEYAGGFPRWLNGVAGSHLTTERFLELNGFFFVVMTAAVALGAWSRVLRPALAVVATVVVLNAVLHIGATLITGSYSPGALSGLVLWLPLGTTILSRLRPVLSRPELLIGMGLGVAAHAMVSLAAIRS